MADQRPGMVIDRRHKRSMTLDDVIGANRPFVVLIHSSASSGRQWQSLSEFLETEFNIVAPDLHGYGSLSDASGSTGFQDDLALVKDVIGQNESGIHLVGHSYGGLLSIRAALDMKPHIRSLTLIEPVCFHLLEEAGEHGALAEITDVRERQVGLTAAGDNDGAARGFIDYWMGRGVWDAMHGTARQAVAEAMPKVAAEWRGAMSPTTCLSDYASLPFPLMLVCAANTTRAARCVTDLIRQRAKKARYEEISDGGHMAPITRRHQVNAVLADYLKSM